MRRTNSAFIPPTGFIGFDYLFRLRLSIDISRGQSSFIPRRVHQLNMASCRTPRNKVNSTKIATISKQTVILREYFQVVMVAVVVVVVGSKVLDCVAINFSRANVSTR